MRQKIYCQYMFILIPAPILKHTAAMGHVPCGRNIDLGQSVSRPRRFCASVAPQPDSQGLMMDVPTVQPPPISPAQYEAIHANGNAPARHCQQTGCGTRSRLSAVPEPCWPDGCWRMVRHPRGSPPQGDCRPGAGTRSRWPVWCLCHWADLRERVFSRT